MYNEDRSEMICRAKEWFDMNIEYFLDDLRSLIHENKSKIVKILAAAVKSDCLPYFDKTKLNMKMKDFMDQKPKGILVSETLTDYFRGSVLVYVYDLIDEYWERFNNEEAGGSFSDTPDEIYLYIVDEQIHGSGFEKEFLTSETFFSRVAPELLDQSISDFVSVS